MDRGDGRKSEQMQREDIVSFSPEEQLRSIAKLKLQEPDEMERILHLLQTKLSKKEFDKPDTIFLQKLERGHKVALIHIPGLVNKHVLRLLEEAQKNDHIILADSSGFDTSEEKSKAEQLQMLIKQYFDDPTSEVFSADTQKIERAVAKYREEPGKPELIIGEVLIPPRPSNESVVTIQLISGETVELETGNITAAVVYDISQENYTRRVDNEVKLYDPCQVFYKGEWLDATVVGFGYKAGQIELKTSNNLELTVHPDSKAVNFQSKREGGPLPPLYEKEKNVETFQVYSFFDREAGVPAVLEITGVSHDRNIITANYAAPGYHMATTYSIDAFFRLPQLQLVREEEDHFKGETFSVWNSQIQRYFPYRKVAQIGEMIYGSLAEDKGAAGVPRLVGALKNEVFVHQNTSRLVERMRQLGPQAGPYPENGVIATYQTDDGPVEGTVGNYGTLPEYLTVNDLNTRYIRQISLDQLIQFHKKNIVISREEILSLLQ